MTHKFQIPEFEEYIRTCGMAHITSRPWNEYEEGVLSEYYGIIPLDVLSKKLGRTIKAIQDKANTMGIKAEENRERKIREMEEDTTGE
jgi:hypothetical protein